MGGICWVAIAAAALTIVSAQSVNDCKGKCNLAICLQVTGNTVNDRVNSDISKALLRDAYGSSAACPGNVGSAFYRSIVRPDDQCSVFPPEPSRRVKQDCMTATFNAQTSDPQVGNELHVCMQHFANSASSFATTLPGECRYTMALVADRDIQDPTQALADAEKLRVKGCAIHCFLVGNTAINYNPAYDEICKYGGITQPSNFTELWQGVENMYGSLDCCDDPLPLITTTPTTTTTTPTTTTTTPTTTTTTPTTTTTKIPTTTEETRPPSVCDGCKIINGVGYVNHPTRCDCWHRCLFKADGSIRVITNCCSCGMFWSQKSMTCLLTEDFKCPGDPCKGNAVNSWPYVGNCRAYWVCDGKRSTETMCCDEGQVYNAITQTCEADVGGNCNDTCPCDLETTSVVCNFLPNPANPRTYFVREFDGSAPTLMDCPKGTSYDATVCKCSTFVDVIKPPCPADFDMRCDEIPVKDHANQVYINNIQVTVDPTNSICSFNGQNSRFLVNRFANYQWRKKFAIFSKFNGLNNYNHDVPLVSNTDCDEAKSVELRLIRGPNDEPLVEAYIKTNMGGFTVSVPYTENEFNEASMHYDGKYLYLCVKDKDGNVVSKKVAATGIVPACHCSLQIGYGWKDRYFEGNIDDTRIYINCIPKDFCNA